MGLGTGLEEFSKLFRGRFYDIGIAEAHGVTFAAALAFGGMKPFVAMYSTFLQRGFDQIIEESACRSCPSSSLSTGAVSSAWMALPITAASTCPTCATFRIWYS